MTVTSGSGASSHKTHVHAHGTKCRSALLQKRVNVEHRKENRRRHHRRSNALLLGNVQIDEPSTRVDDNNDIPFEIPADSVITQLLADVMNDAVDRSCCCGSESLHTTRQPPPPSPITPSSSIINCSPISSTDELDEELLLDYSSGLIGIQKNSVKVSFGGSIAEELVEDSFDTGFICFDDVSGMQIDCNPSPDQSTTTNTKSVPFSVVSNDFETREANADLNSLCDSVVKGQATESPSETLPTSSVKDIPFDQNPSALVLMMHHIHLQEVSNNKHLSQQHNLVIPSASPSASLQVAFYA